MSVEHVTADLVADAARAFFERPDAPCPWDAVDPIHQHVLKESALAWFQSTIPVLIAHGWTPPKQHTGIAGILQIHGAHEAANKAAEAFGSDELWNDACPCQHNWKEHEKEFGCLHGWEHDDYGYATKDGCACQLVHTEKSPQ